MYHVKVYNIVHLEWYTFICMFNIVLLFEKYNNCLSNCVVIFSMSLDC